MSEQIRSKSLAGPSEICMLMPIRKGFTEGLATRTYESRLRSFAKLFADLRAVTRESRLSRPFSDIVDRLQTIHGVTIAIVDGQLLLTVHFDRPWEPYIRIIWEELGDIFDLILCNCEGYVEAHRNNLGFEAFAGWIRKYQVETATFYLEGNHTVGDVIYLDRLERRVRVADPDPVELARLTIETPEARAAAVRRVLTGGAYVDYIKQGVQAIAAFHALTFLYPKGTNDHSYLLRAARSVLPPEEFPPRADWRMTEETGPALETLKGVFFTELDWFENCSDAGDLAPPSAAPPTFDPGNVQGGIITRFDADVGALVLLEVRDPARARRFLDAFGTRVTWESEAPADGIYRNVAFSAGGLARLELPPVTLDALPAAFREGMAARAGLIGDLRHNHPDHWVLPERNWPPGRAEDAAAPAQRVNVESVDVVIQLRTLASKRPDPTALDPALTGEVERIAAAADGALAVLSVQPMYAQGEPGAGIEHFGFRDGISNPKIDPDHTGATDVVPPGDVFLGQPNSRGDRLATRWSDPLFRDGTFQVIRKLAQDVAVLNKAVDANLPPRSKLSGSKREAARDALLARLMGRRKTGEPLVEKPASVGDNAFDFDKDPDGDRCPVFAHIRRANPRDDGETIPRILRRGMSYGAPYRPREKAPVERGLIFQAYNASLAEQYEVVQRWLTGANRTAPYSRLSDPILGVPEPGEPRVYRFADGSRLDLGDQPFVRLQWGLYLFVPSRVGLAIIAGPQTSAGARDWTAEGIATIDALRALEATDRDAAFAAWKRLLEEKEALDEQRHRGVWQAIRERHKGVLRTPFGVLVGSAALVRHVLATPADFSVAGYQERLARCVGENYLGMDPPLHDRKADAANAVFHAISQEDAFDAVLPLAGALLGGLSQVGGQATIPMAKYADLVLAEVSKYWFGVPDATTLLERLGGAPVNPDAAIQAGGEAPSGAATSHCPFHVISSSRFVFQPRPTNPVDATATQEGRNLRAAMDRFVAPHLENPRKRWPKPLLAELHRVLKKEGLEADFAEVLLGALLGYMPTVQGNFLFTTRDWLRDGDFWRVQNDYLSARRGTLSARRGTLSARRGAGAQGMTAREAAFHAIEPWLARGMSRRPIPAMIHRRATREMRLADEPVRPGEMIVVGLVSATAESDFTDVSPAFGGSWYDEPRATHACPGRKLGMGTLLGMIAALFELPGTLRRAPSSSALLFDPP
jgi:Dyp-type peroxidase family